MSKVEETIPCIYFSRQISLPSTVWKRYHRGVAVHEDDALLLNDGDTLRSTRPMDSRILQSQLNYRGGAVDPGE